MSIARVVARLAAFVIVLVLVMAAYNYGAYALVRHALSQAKNNPPFPTTTLETSFDGQRFDNLHDGYLYRPDRNRGFGDK